jgi:uncharacterized membrane protein YfcA
LANCAGIGGGGTLVPIIRLFFNFVLADAITLSNATIAVAATMRYIYNFRKTHPLRYDTNGKNCGTIVDYNITAVMMPMIIVGSAIGAIINYILPEPASTTVLFITLTYILISHIYRLKMLITKENADIVKRN